MTLNKNGESATIALPQNIDGEIRIKLTWTKDTNAGFFQRMLGADSVDLDLGCYYELANGERTLIDCLQFVADGFSPSSEHSKQGCYDEEPYIWHTGDHRGQSRDEAMEEILVNPAGLPHIKNITVYAYIFDGPASWEAFGAKVAIEIPGCDPVEMALPGDGSKNRFCAAMRLEVCDDAKSIKATKLGTMHLGHSDCDQDYGWGLKYRSA
ncbi:MAG: hypothetical protein NC102_08705 [Clostridium sp.]|nr:hypothetical protein [Clostridium sp.]